MNLFLTLTQNPNPNVNPNPRVKYLSKFQIHKLAISAHIVSLFIRLWSFCHHFYEATLLPSVNTNAPGSFCVFTPCQHVTTGRLQELDHPTALCCPTPSPSHPFHLAQRMHPHQTSCPLSVCDVHQKHLHPAIFSSCKHTH